MFKKIISGMDCHDEDLDLEEMKLIDFGLCADVTDHSFESLLNDKSGTVGYLAPELITCKKGEFYGEKVDVFSAGMIFYEMYKFFNLLYMMLTINKANRCKSI